MDVCSCGTGAGNSGLPTCFEIFGVTKVALFGEYFDANGNPRFIDTTSAEFTQANLDALTRNRSSRERIYPTPELKNIEDLRDDNVDEEFEDGTSRFVRVGVRTFLGWAVGVDTVWLDNFNKWRCLNPGVWFVDKPGNLIGNGATEGQLRMIRIEKGSLTAKLIKGNDTTIQKAEITFTVSDSERDEDLRMITAENISANLLGATGMIDVVGRSVTNISTTGFQADLDTLYGSINNPIPAEGIEVTDVEVFNKNTSLAVTGLAIVENEGVYTFTFDAQTSADVLEVRTAPADPIVKQYEITPFEVVIP